jgi:hypothetical protein
MGDSVLTPVFGNQLVTENTAQRFTAFQISSDFMMSRSLMIFAQVNMKAGLFQNADLQLWVESSLRDIGEPWDRFASDSIDFCYLVCRKLEAVCGDPFLEMVLLVNVIAWHFFMKNGRNGSEMIHRLFITDATEYKVCLRVFLMSLHAIRVHGTSSVKWMEFSRSVIEMAEMAPISKHHSVMGKFGLTIHGYSGDTRISVQQATLFHQLLFNLSMVSFLLHKENIREAHLRLLNPDGSDELGSFVKCIFGEVLDPAISALKEVIDPLFFIRMTNDG